MAALCIVARNCKQPDAYKWLTRQTHNDMLCNWNHLFSSRRSILLIHTVTWVSLQRIVLRTSQSLKVTCCMILAFLKKCYDRIRELMNYCKELRQGRTQDVMDGINVSVVIAKQYKEYLGNSKCFVSSTCHQHPGHNILMEFFNILLLKTVLNVKGCPLVTS